LGAHIFAAAARFSARTWGVGAADEEERRCRNLRKEPPGEIRLGSAPLAADDLASSRWLQQSAMPSSVTTPCDTVEVITRVYAACTTIGQPAEARLLCMPCTAMRRMNARRMSLIRRR
jgi:hypothetical protein